jgi:hypothetical protein
MKSRVSDVAALSLDEVRAAQPSRTIDFDKIAESSARSTGTWMGHIHYH